MSNCDLCIYRDSVGGYPDGQDMFVCQIEDRMTDNDVELSNVGQCPYYVYDKDYFGGIE